MADIVFITTSDGAIEDTCKKITLDGGFHKGSIVFHTCGALPSAILGHARKSGAAVASLHPLQSLANVQEAIKNLRGSCFSLEGDHPAVAAGKKIVKTLKGRKISLRAGTKPLNHAGAAVASNFLVATIGFGMELFEAAGIRRDDALRALMPLIKGTIKNVEKLGIPHALTGPVSRGDIGVVKNECQLVPTDAQVGSCAGGPCVCTTVEGPNTAVISLPARVRLAPEYAITISDPVYRPGTGWLAEIRNGSLNEAGDFLFYEAVVPAFGWQKEEGYVIRAEYREQDMASMLGHYGFNEKETVEFIDYWANHLVEDTDFVFYPQETEAVNRDMPLTIRPKPDHVMRIWYYAEPLVSAPEPVMSPERIVREGFYVVEWGVIITNEEYWSASKWLSRRS